jgi:hypothetical protein
MSYSSTSDNFLQIPNTALIELNLSTTRFEDNSVLTVDEPRHDIDSVANGTLFDYQVFQSNSEQPKIIGTGNHKYTNRGGQARLLNGSVLNEPDKFYLIDTDYIILPETVGEGIISNYQVGSNLYDGFNNYPSAFNIVLANSNYDKEINGAMDKYVDAPLGSYTTRFTPGWFRANVGVRGVTRYNPIVEVGLFASSGDILGEGGQSWVFKESGAPYEGLYHRHLDGTAMIGQGVLNTNHEINPNEVIIPSTYAGEDAFLDEEERTDGLVYTTPPPNILSVREKVSDIFYKVWFESNTFSEQEILSMQTTIRDGIKQTGRTEDEPLVFYKKDRNTLESRKDLQGEVFNQMCQYIFENNIVDLDGLFSIEQENGASENNQNVINYKINFDNGRFKINVAKKVGESFTDVLNLSQLTKPKFGSRIDAEKAREVLDTNIFELLPNQTTRQDQINDFFTEFDNLIGPTPFFQDVDGDGVGEDIQNKEQDEQSRISFENQSHAFITRLDEQAEGSSINQG